MRLLPPLLAVVAPALVVGSALAWSGRPEPEQQKSAALAECQATVEKDGADVVVLGNSKVRSDLDLREVAKALGVPKAARLNVDGTGAPVWYATLANCVYATTRTPGLVIVYGTLGATTRTTLESEADRTKLAAFAAEADPVVVRKVFGGEVESPFWARVKARRTAFHTSFQEGVRDLAGALFAPPGNEGLLAAGRAYAEPALERAFGGEAGPDATARRAIPIAEVDAAPTAPRTATYDGTFLPDLVALAQGHHARFLYVSAPISDRMKAYEVVPDGMTREVVQGLNAGGAGYIDLSTLQLPESAYADGIHMNSAGRTRTTAALAEALRTLGDGPFTPASLPHAPPKVSRSGTPPALPKVEPVRGPWECGWEARFPTLAAISDSVLAAGPGVLSPVVLYEDGKPLTGHAGRADFDAACHGAFSHQGAVLKFSPTGGPPEVVSSRAYTLGLTDDVSVRDAHGREGWWVYPGTALQVDFPEGWEGADFRVALSGVVAGGTSPATMEATGVAAAAVGPFPSVLAPPAPGGPWSVTVRSPAAGPWLLVTRLVVGTPENPWYALGKPPAPRSAEMLAGTVAYAASPPPVPHAELGKPVKHSGHMWKVDAPDLGVPPFELIRDVTGLNGCSPLRLFEDGKAVPGPDTSPQIIQEKGQGGSFYGDFKVYFSTVDDSSPADNGRRYTVALDPERACHANRWLYPGDSVTLSPTSKQLGVLAGGATRLELGAAALTRAPSPAKLHVRLLRGDAVLVEGDVALAELDAHPPRWDLPSPVPRDATDVRLELSIPTDAPYVLVTGAALVEPPEPAFPAEAVAGP